jgi:hypothetical protein
MEIIDIIYILSFAGFVVVSYITYNQVYNDGFDNGTIATIENISGLTFDDLDEAMDWLMNNDETNFLSISNNDIN